jgi:4-hydroxymandelate oxidase
MEPLSLRDFEAEAKRRLDTATYDLFAGGADDEVTLRANESAFKSLALVPRVLQGQPVPDLDLTLLGSRVAMPVFLAPTAFQRLAHPEGECATARAAAAANTIMTVSMAATVAVEEITDAARTKAGDGVKLWFQIYIQPDLGFTQAVIRRAETAGCQALVITVDSPVFGRRERDLRNGFSDLPSGMCCENMRERTSSDEYGPPRSIAFSSELSWDHIAWLRRTTSLPIILKGILHPDDAKLAVHHGVDAIIVSNHGGRQLDTVPATIEVLPAMAKAINGDIPLLLDGGIRRGTDVVKALALGATAVMIGRPALWGLAVAGEEGVARVLEMLRSELERALTLCGCATLKDVNRNLVRFQRWEEPS